MTNINKQKVLAAIEAKAASLGSAEKVAEACGLNASYSEWQMAETHNYKLVWQTCQLAKDRALFMAISNAAGSGKSATARDFAQANAGGSVHYFLVEHSEMGRGDFLDRLARSLGLPTPTGGAYRSSTRKADDIIAFFTQRFEQAPLLIVDEADKLNDTALRFFISLFNKVEGRMGCVLLGTENLWAKIMRGVAYNKNGFDELRSRFGGRAVTLPGLRKSEAVEIAIANGLSDKEAIDRAFADAEPASVVMDGRTVQVVRDVRTLRRKIERELMMSKTATL